jgi:5S rRNA maturation endonuclease (ribonuclease M5)
MKEYDLEVISELLIENITDLFDHFGLDYQDSIRSISFACPIHDGDNEYGCSILKRDIGNWKCYTAQCHEQYGTANGASILQFVQALLEKTYDRKYTFPQAVEWAAGFVGEDPTVQTQSDRDRMGFIKLCKYLNRKKKENPNFTPREKVREFLAIPSAYYMKRGYSKHILEKFDVGYCHKENKPFFDRIVTPFYDDSGQYMVGCSGRSRHEECPKCRKHHDPNVRCPITREEKMRCMKWKHSTLMNSEDYLYNYWNAKSFIEETGTAILVEGPGDVWRLEEAGIHNSLALLKAMLSPGQRMILESSLVINVVIATDMDDAGKKGAHSIKDTCQQLFNITRIEYPTKDIGELQINQVKEIFLPVLEKL